MERFVIMHKNDAASEAPSICECDEGFCYDHYATEAEAQASCDKVNAHARANNWGSVYWPAQGPEGITYA